MRAAAVCYRRRNDRVEFLLVRTKGGRYWTFPKGHVEKSEYPHQAAAREAREEAGVSGRVEEVELIRYRFPAGEGKDIKVQAFLLEVSEESAPEEPERRPAWVSPDVARTRLGEGRDAVHAGDQARVIDAALQKLEG